MRQENNNVNIKIHTLDDMAQLGIAVIDGHTHFVRVDHRPARMCSEDELAYAINMTIRSVESSVLNWVGLLE